MKKRVGITATLLGVSLFALTACTGTLANDENQLSNAETETTAPNYAEQIDELKERVEKLEEKAEATQDENKNITEIVSERNYDQLSEGDEENFFLDTIILQIKSEYKEKYTAKQFKADDFQWANI